MTDPPIHQMQHALPRLGEKSDTKGDPNHSKGVTPCKDQMAMPTFYTLDRVGTLYVGLEIVLEKCNDIRPPEFQRHADSLFPQGFFRHGERYFLKNASQLPLTNPTIELVFEYVRRAYFPNCPSRFQSAFGCESIPDAVRFRNRYGNGRGTIWEVSSDDYFRADMNLLSDRNTILVASYFAHMYWAGDVSPQPLIETLLVPPVRVIRRVVDV